MTNLFYDSNLILNKLLYSIIKINLNKLTDPLYYMGPVGCETNLTYFLVPHSITKI